MSRAHVYKRDHINTDEIIPARYLNTDDQAELAKHCLEDLDPDFVSKVQPGDIIVAGEDFGCGSSREHAVWAIRGAKVQTVIAKSFARIFYRNSINNGFYIIESPDALEKIKDGDELEIDYKAGQIRNKTAGVDIKFKPLPDFALEIIKAGGLLEHIKRGQGPVVRGQGPGARGQGPGVRGQGPGVRGQGSGARGQGPGVRDQGTGKIDDN